MPWVNGDVRDGTAPVVEDPPVQFGNLGDEGRLEHLEICVPATQVGQKRVKRVAVMQANDPQ